MPPPAQPPPASETETGPGFGHFGHSVSATSDPKIHKTQDAAVPTSMLPGRPQAVRLSSSHFILKTPLQGPYPQGMEKLIFACGCFWQAERGAWRLPGVYATSVGYAAGCTPNPTYDEVCNEGTGAAQAVQVIFDPSTWHHLASFIQLYSVDFIWIPCVSFTTTKVRL